MLAYVLFDVVAAHEWIDVKMHAKMTHADEYLDFISCVSDVSLAWKCMGPLCSRTLLKHKLFFCAWAESSEVFFNVFICETTSTQDDVAGGTQQSVDMKTRLPRWKVRGFVTFDRQQMLLILQLCV